MTFPSLKLFLPSPAQEPEPEAEPEAKPQDLADDAEKKKLKKLKRMSNTQTIMSGFEEAFEQFATSTINNSKKTMFSHFNTVSTNNNMEVSATQVRLGNLSKRFRQLLLLYTQICVKTCTHFSELLRDKLTFLENVGT